MRLALAVVAALALGGCGAPPPTAAPPTDERTSVTTPADQTAQSDLIAAAGRGQADVVAKLVRAGAGLADTAESGRTAVHEAIALGDGGPRYVDTVRVLVAAGADLGVPWNGATPAEHAKARGLTAVESALTAVADAGSILTAAAEGDADAVAAALRAGGDIEARDGRDRTPLLLAATHDRVDVARLLVAMGANPNAVDGQRDTPWLVTGVTGSVAMGETLLPARPDLGLRNRFGGVSVIPASERGHVDYVRWVVGTGIDVNHVNDLGWTALLEAVILGDGSAPYQEIVRILLDAGADRSLADKEGVTAMDHARAKDQHEIARILANG